MGKLYDISLLPNQQAINLVAILSHELEEERVNFNYLLPKLKLAISDSGFMKNQDHKSWFYTHGLDYSSNPKLFDSAPLNVTCAYLSEIFKHYKIEQITEGILKKSIVHALLRLSLFTGDVKK